MTNTLQKRKIIADLDVRWVVIISQDSYYKGLAAGVDPAAFNFDHPDALDYDLMRKTISDLKSGRSADIPQYSFTSHSRYLKREERKRRKEREKEKKRKERKENKR